MYPRGVTVSKLNYLYEDVLIPREDRNKPVAASELEDIHAILYSAMQRI